MTQRPLRIAAPRRWDSHGGRPGDDDAGRDDAVGRRGGGYRPDIDALRAVAIVIVVAFHAGVPGFRGGFTGVDVFFVISGFVILRSLTDERARTGHVGWWAFYGRRVRRLAPPAALLMIAVTTVLSMFVFNPHR